MQNITQEHDLTPSEDCIQKLGIIVNDNSTIQTLTEWIGLREFSSTVDQDILVRLQNRIEALF